MNIQFPRAPGVHLEQRARRVADVAGSCRVIGIDAAPSKFSAAWPNKIPMCRRPGASNFASTLPSPTELPTDAREGIKSSSMEEYYASNLAALSHFDRHSCGGG